MYVIGSHKKYIMAKQNFESEMAVTDYERPLSMISCKSTPPVLSMAVSVTATRARC